MQRESSKRVQFTSGLVLLLVSVFASAMSPPIKDTITGTPSGTVLGSGAASTTVNLIDISYTPISITSQLTIGHIDVLSEALSTATSFRYSIREGNAPYTEIDTGPATLVNRTVFPDVTLGANPSNLDEFEITSAPLAPGDYYITVYSTDSEYSLAFAFRGAGLEPILRQLLNNPPTINNRRLFFRISPGQASASMSLGTTAVPAIPPMALGFLALVILGIVKRKLSIKHK
ncbi:hypothetical protein [Pseudoteredinibacter isoporae]|uniref:Uncharacterized protein n=1 Tax=Pseudoteredinibacter isoporae TaxID=570281 RepID=A0A7X0MX18_9GAMM|nr:hypothetical protein [Pseudoteredinibacter isoporae]MBB6523008.1 hypothetical protein [Pseudoteredinibacter isoporae]NHO88530.1 hypothetical protein [Pseudoteredinibacter isoporae]NIB22779.1 hypothetical protein [Pseudoteredinibacter isoporae]